MAFLENRFAGNYLFCLIAVEIGNFLGEGITSEPERLYLLRGMAMELQDDREQAAWSYIRALREAPANEAINRHVMRFFSARQLILRRRTHRVRIAPCEVQ